MPVLQEFEFNLGPSLPCDTVCQAAIQQEIPRQRQPFIPGVLLLLSYSVHDGGTEQARARVTTQKWLGDEA